VSYSLLVRPEAQADLAETRKWYEEQATGLGRRSYRALAVDAQENVVWFWIGTHAEYDRLVG
jgi:hypothetical protein